MQNVTNIQRLAAEVLNHKNLESQAKAGKNTASAALMYHAAKAYRDDDKEAIQHIEGRLEKNGEYYDIRGMFSKAKRVGKSQKAFTESDSISAIYAALLKEEKADSAPLDAEKAARKAVMESLGIDMKRWNALTHKEKGELLEQGEKIVAERKAAGVETIILDRAELLAALQAFVNENGLEQAEALLAEIVIPESEQSQAA